MNLHRKKIRQITALLLAASLCLVSCRSPFTATTMELNKTQGTVNIHDGKQKEIEPKEQLNLYSGYQLETQTTSYAWINLDKVKLTKMDAESEIEITKKRNNLEIMVHSGKLFFHITEPLEDNESLNIRTSSMIVGIRGTCGWVEASGQNQMKVYTLEGTVGCRRDKSGKEYSGKEDSDREGSPAREKAKQFVQTLLRRLLKTLPGLNDILPEDDVEPSQEKTETSQKETYTSQAETDTPIGTEEETTENTVPEKADHSAGEETEKEITIIENGHNNIYYVECMDDDEEVYVSAGNMAELTLSPDGEEQIILSSFTTEDIPDYIMEELLGDEDLQQKIFEESGLDIGSTPNENAEQGDEIPDNQPGEDESPDNRAPEDETGQASFFLKNTVYYGDLEKCRLTPAQARLFAETLESAIREAKNHPKPSVEANMPPEFKSIVADLGTKYPIQSYAAIFDAGDGIPGVFFSSGYYNESLTLSEYFNPEKDTVYWEWDAIRQTVFYLGKPDEVYSTGLTRLALGDGYLINSYLSGDNYYYESYVYPLIEGHIGNASTMASGYPMDGYEYQVDWLPASKESFEQWRNQWDVPTQVGYSCEDDSTRARYSCHGMVPAEEVLNVLNAYANQS